LEGTLRLLVFLVWGEIIMLMEKITSITFKRTSNIFVNAGIVGLYQFVQKYRIAHPDKFPSLEFSTLINDELTISCDELMEFLEDIYYFMGKTVYDTATKKQKDENYNVYYIEKTNTFKRFPKMNTYGLTHLFTNNAQGVTRKKENAPKIAQLKKSNPVLADKIAQYFESQNVKLLSKVYLNEPYTKITRLELNEKYLFQGNLQCPIIGESFKTLVDATNISPFFSGIANFNSFLGAGTNKIAWKALYIIRFSPVLCYYSYQNSYDTIICSFFNSNSLENIAELYNTPIFRQKDELESTNYLVNFKLENFKIQNKSNEETEIDTSKDGVWQSEIAFMLLYTFYKKQFEREIIEDNQEEVKVDPFADNPLDKIPISLITFRADKFASTLRPSFYEEYNNVKYIIRLFYQLEAHEKISVYSIWQGLKLKTAKADAMKDFSKKKAVIRQIRATVLGKVLKGKTIIHELEKLYFNSFKYLMDSKTHPGYRSYKKLLTFLLVYEKSINFGNNKNMNAELQQQAVNLGKSVGIKMIEFEGSDKRTNAKNGRKYIIRLHKARTLEQFTEALIGVMKKYTLSNKVIETIDKDNFILIRQYTVIGALNVINGFLSSSKNND